MVHRCSTSNPSLESEETLTSHPARFGGRTKELEMKTLRRILRWILDFGGLGTKFNDWMNRDD